MNGDNSFGWNHEATLDNIHAQKYNKAYAGARLTAELKYLLQDVESFEPNSKYTIHEVVLGPGYSTPDYTGQTIGYVVTLPAQMLIAGHLNYQQSIFISTNFALLQAFLMPSDSSLLHC
ncbi:hypothetical protein VEE72_39320 [Escherichia coli]|nr:hypothetical protein VEGS07_39480 [Escherichia coli]BED33238.1 hypothetical protein VEE72_39320 [Escherichia coli]